MKIIRQSDLLKIAMLDPGWAETVAIFEQANHEHFSKWDIDNSPFHSAEYWFGELQKADANFRELQYFNFHIQMVNDPLNEIIGFINVLNLRRDNRFSAELSFGISKSFEHRGIMRASLEMVISYLFNEMNLHKISACYSSNNSSSKRLLEKLKFSIEGIQKEALFFKGRWNDLVQTSLINPDFRNTELQTQIA